MVDFRGLLGNPRFQRTFPSNDQRKHLNVSREKNYSFPGYFSPNLEQLEYSATDAEVRSPVTSKMGTRGYSIRPDTFAVGYTLRLGGTPASKNTQLIFKVKVPFKAMLNVYMR